MANKIFYWLKFKNDFFSLIIKEASCISVGKT